MAGESVVMLRRVADSFPHFVRIDRDSHSQERHYVVHTQDPQLMLELKADDAAPDKVGRGVIRRVCVPNSWAGDYSKYAKLLTKAQEFFAQSGGGGRPGR